MAIAPFHATVLTLGPEPELRKAAEELCAALAAAGVEVLFDDRDERAGVKFKDADLIGHPAAARRREEGAGRRQRGVEAPRRRGGGAGAAGRRGPTGGGAGAGGGRRGGAEGSLTNAHPGREREPRARSSCRAGEADALGLAGGGQGELVSARGAFALLVPARGDEPQAPGSPGSLAALTVPEVIQFIFTSLKTGVLLLAFGRGSGPGGARAGAAPPQEHLLPGRPDRLRLLVATGPTAWARCCAARAWSRRRSSSAAATWSAPAVRSGRCMVDEGVLSAGQLYEGISLQVKEILLNAFAETEGTFAFLEGVSDERNAVKLAQRTRDLLLEGMRRVEEAEALARELGGREVVFVRGAETARPLTPEEDALLQAVDGRRPLGALALDAGLGQLLALEAAATLFRDGVLRPAPPAAPEPEPEPEAEAEAAVEGTPTQRITGPFETYRRIFARVHEALAAREGGTARLASYFDRLPPRNRAVFDGVRFGPDGELEVSRVLENVTRAGEYKGAAARARALEALEDLLAFALFEVKNCLDRAGADAVLREVGRMQMGRA